MSLSCLRVGSPHASLMQPPRKKRPTLTISLGSGIREAAWNRFRLLLSDKCPAYGQDVCHITGISLPAVALDVLFQSPDLFWVVVLFCGEFFFVVFFGVSAARAFYYFRTFRKGGLGDQSGTRWHIYLFKMLESGIALWNVSKRRQCPIILVLLFFFFIYCKSCDLFWRQTRWITTE